LNKTNLKTRIHSAEGKFGEAGISCGEWAVSRSLRLTLAEAGGMLRFREVQSEVEQQRRTEW